MSDRDKTPPAKSARSPEQRVRKFERHVVEEIELVDTPAVQKAVKRERFNEFRFAAIWVGLWALLVAASLFVRNTWPSDETRMLGIAWEMWARGKFLVPYLNGEPTLHPPFFFWLVHLGWLVVGVAEWWARLVAPLGVLTSLFATYRIARLLWPQEREVARYAPLVLLGTIAFAFAVGPALPDTWLLAFVLLAFWGLLIQWRRRDVRASILTAAALGAGTLTAGLIVFAYVLPVALLAPLWARSPKPRWKHWYGDFFKATAVALVCFGAWAAALGVAEGGPQAARLLFNSWKGLPLDLFAREQPWWWYAFAAPLAFLPWSVLPLAWMHLWHIRREPLDDGFTFCLTWIVMPLLVLSLLPVKQPQYLLALLPAGALLTSRLLLADGLRSVHEDKGFAGMAIPLILCGGVLMVLPRLPRVDFLPQVLWQQSPLLGLAIIGVGIVAGWLRLKDVHKRVIDLVAINVLLVTFVLLATARPFNAKYPLADIGRLLAQAEAQGQPIALAGEYRGEFHFAGRLRAPLSQLAPERVESWAAAYPNGVLVTRMDGWQPRTATPLTPLLETPFNDSRVQILSAQDLLNASATR
jgi:4-amino-4-deoxy-L-arabinose transferase-like glycosyltransferase